MPPALVSPASVVPVLLSNRSPSLWVTDFSLAMNVSVEVVSPRAPESVPLLTICAAFSVSASSLIRLPLLFRLPLAITVVLPFAPVSPERVTLRARISSVEALLSVPELVISVPETVRLLP
ncbi:hypothetical protein ENROMA047B_23835 [Enterobacter rongchengensis]